MYRLFFYLSAVTCLVFLFFCKDAHLGKKRGGAFLYLSAVTCLVRERARKAYLLLLCLLCYCLTYCFTCCVTGCDLSGARASAKGRRKVRSQVRHADLLTALLALLAWCASERERPRKSVASCDTRISSARRSELSCCATPRARGASRASCWSQAVKQVKQ